MTRSQQKALPASDTGASRDNPFVFVVGCPRSGTTLLQRILDHHPMLAVANDTHFIPRCLERNFPLTVRPAIAGRPVALTAELARTVRDYKRFYRLGLTAADAEEQAIGAESYQHYVSALYTLFASRQGKPLGGEKTPDYVRRLPLLHGLFPRSKFVHIVRDGRDVALSMLDWAGQDKGPAKLELFASQPVATCALWWAWQVGSGRSDGRCLGPGHYLDLRYEDLIGDPALEAKKLTTFLGLPFDRQMLAYHEGRSSTDLQLSSKDRWLPPTPGLRDWRTQMSELDVALFEALAADQLIGSGYELGVTDIPDRVKRIARDAQTWWDAYLDRKTRTMRRRQGGWV